MLELAIRRTAVLHPDLCSVWNFCAWTAETQKEQRSPHIRVAKLSEYYSVAGPRPRSMNRRSKMVLREEVQMPCRVPVEGLGVADESRRRSW